MVQRIQKIQERREGGFTLIELLIVIVVLGILAGIVVLGLGTFKKDAETAACNADKKQVQIAIDAYMARPGGTGNPPTPSGDFTALTTAPKLLKSPPATTGITWDTTTGDVTGPTCS